MDLDSLQPDQYRILDRVTEGCQVIGSDWRYVYINDAAARHGLRPKEELLGSRMQDQYPGIETTAMFGTLERCMRERTSVHIENEFEYPNGTLAWFDLSVQPVPDGILILSLDITKFKQTERELNRAALRMQILHNIDQGLILGKSVHTLVENTLKQLRVLIPCQRANFAVIDDAQKEATVFALDLDGDTALREGTTIPITPFATEGLDERHSRIVNDLRLIQDAAPEVRLRLEEGVASAMQVLLVDQERPIGSLSLLADTAGFFTDEHRDVAIEIANQLALALRHQALSQALTERTAALEQKNQDLQRADAALKRHAQRLEILHDIDLGIIQARSVESLLQSTLGRLKTLIPCRRVGLVLFEADRNTAVMLSSDFEEDSEVKAGAHVPMPQSGWLESFSPQGTKVVPDVLAVPEPIPLYGFAVKEGTRSLLHVLLVSDGEPVGLLNLLADTPDFFEPEHQEIAVEVGAQFAVAIRQMRLDKETRRHLENLKQVQATLQLSEARYRSVIEDQTELICRYDESFRLTFVNRAYADSYGMHVAEMNGKTFLENIPPAERERAVAHVKALTPSNPVATSEHQSVMPDGTTRWVQWTDRALLDDSGNIVEYQGVGRDITQRVAAEQALTDAAAELEERVSERTIDLSYAKERVEAILNNSLDAIVFALADFTIQQVNPAFSLLFAVHPARYADRQLLDLFAPGDVERVSAIIQGVNADHQGRQFEARARHLDGSSFDVEVSVGYFKGAGNGNSDGYVFVFRDITLRKRADESLREKEARFRLLAENVTDVIARLDPAGIRTYVTPSAYTMLGYKPEELLGKNAFDIVHPDDQLGAQTVMQEALASGLSSFSITVRTRHKDGRYIWVEGTNNIVRDPISGSPKESVGVYREVTERKQAEEALKSLHEVTVELTQIDSLDSFFERAVALGIQRLGFERLAIFLYDESDGSARGTYGTDVHGSVVDERHLHFMPDSNGIIMQSLSRIERFYYAENVSLYNDQEPIGHGWNAASVLRNRGQSLGWLIADNLLSQTPASKPLLEILGLYSLTIGTLLAQKRMQLDLRDREERFRQYFELPLIGMAVTTPDKKWINVNDKLCAIFKYSREELARKTWEEITHPDDLASDIAQFEQVTAGAIDGYSIDKRFIRQDGQTIFTTVTIRAVRHPGGQLNYFVGLVEDITERKRAETALRESEAKFRSLLEAAPVAIVIADEAGRIVLVNHQAESLFGYDQDELIQQPIEILMPETVRETHTHHRFGYSELPNVRQMGSGLELFARRKDGNTFPVEIELGYTQSSTGLLVLSFIVDITERKERERQLLYHASLQENVTDAVIATDLEFVIQSWNKAAEKIYGWRADEVVGRPIDEILNTQFSSGEAAERIADEFLEHGAWSAEVVQNHRDGTEIHILSSVVLFKDRKDRPLGVVAVNHDITARKNTEHAIIQSEASLRSVMNSTSVGIMLVDTTGVIRLANNLASEYGILLYGHTAELDKTRLFDLDLTDRAGVEYLFSRALSGQRTNVELSRTVGARTYVLDLRYDPVMLPDGSVIGAAISFVDITERKGAEEALHSALAKEKELNELKSRFISMASHEFRTPLASILALTETLHLYRHNLSEEQMDQRFDKIKDQISHLKDIMEDVLLLARLQARRVEFNPVLIDLDSLCRSVIDEFESQPGFVHPIRYTCDPSLRSVRLDKKLMRQTLSNLVSNAVKYSPDTSVIRVDLQSRDNTLTIITKDQGIGIPEDDLQHLFQPFHRASNVDAIPGTGLGLVIVKESIELHGGSIAVESQMHIGTTFIITIPLN